MMLSHSSSSLLFAAALCSVLVDGQVDVPSPSNFVRRNWHSATVLGNYAYIDGGDISQYVSNESSSSPEIVLAPMNATLSISLNESWTPANLSFQAIEKDSLVPKLNGLSLWADVANNTLISFGGEANGMVEPRTSLWVFTPNGRGGGAWGNLGSGNASGIARRAYSASVVCAGIGVQLGGYGSKYTDAVYSNQVPVPGLVSYNLPSSASSGSGSWLNTSSALEVGSYEYGDAVCLPSYGQGGLAVFIGGLSAGPNTNSGDLVSLNNLTLYDPQSRRWYWQMTGGQAPRARQQPCAVAVEGPNSTEIFIYGGYDNGLLTSFSDVWVLTIPGFQWFQSNASGTGTLRVGHQCVVGGKGNRQMISIGGFNQTNSEEPAWNIVDPWTNGVGVLDLPSMTWTNVYNATADSYSSPQIVQDWYSGGNLESVGWSSDEVKSLFLRGYNTSTNSPSPSQSPGQSPSQSPNKTNSGAIAGGVVGGVAAVALAAGLAFYLMRARQRRRTRRAASIAPNTKDQYGKVELNAEEPNKLPAPSPPELPAHTPPRELPADAPPGELPG